MKNQPIPFDSDVSELADHLEELARAAREGRLTVCAIQAVYVPTGEESEFYHLEHYGLTGADIHTLLGCMAHHSVQLTHTNFGPES